MDFCPLTDPYIDAVNITGHIDIINDEHEEKIINTIEENITQGNYLSFTIAKETQKKNGTPTKPHFHFSFIPSYALSQVKQKNKDKKKAFSDSFAHQLRKLQELYGKYDPKKQSFKLNTLDSFVDLKQYIKGLAYTIKQGFIRLTHNENYLEDALTLANNYKEEFARTKKASSKDCLLEYFQETKPSLTCLEDLQNEMINYYKINDLLVPPPVRFKSLVIYLVHKQYTAYNDQIMISIKQSYFL